VVERVCVEGYPLPGAEGRPAGSILPPALLGRPLVFRTGWLAGEPVAAAASHVGPGGGDLCLAAALPAGPRRGAGASPRVGPHGRRARSPGRGVHERPQPPRLRAHGVRPRAPLHAVDPDGLTVVAAPATPSGAYRADAWGSDRSVAETNAKTGPKPTSP